MNTFFGRYTGAGQGWLREGRTQITHRDFDGIGKKIAISHSAKVTRTGQDELSRETSK